MPCEAKNRPVMKAWSINERCLYLYMAKCKSWYCPHCGHMNKLMWIAKVSQGIDHYYRTGITDWMFCTVTSHPKLRNRDQCLWVAPKAWKKLWSRIHYHHGKVRYIYIPELHKNGRVHWHFIMSGGIPVAWWKKHATRSGFGYMADSQPVRDGFNSVLYVSKELGKSLSSSKWPRSLRRIRTNQKWPDIADGDDFNDLDLPWVYFCNRSSEELEDLRELTEYNTGIRTVVLGKEK